jgi:hypothetical protein
MKFKRRLGWKPVRRGDIYCAPACGCGCTYQAYLRAVAAAKKLAKELPGFKPHVWENVGWHYSVVAHGGRVSVYNNFGSYNVLASLVNPHAGDPEWGNVTARSAKKAIQKLRANLCREISKMQLMLQRLERATK